MNRRQFLAAAGGAVAAAGGYAGLRLTDYRRYEPGEPGGETPSERVVAAARYRYAAAHRAETTVRVTADSGGPADYLATRYRQWHDHARFRHTHAYTTRRRPPTDDDESLPPPLPGLLALLHWAGGEDPPAAATVFVTDGLVTSDFDAPLVGPAERPRFGDDARATVADERTAGMFSEFLRPHDAEWRRVDGPGAVTYELGGLDDYAKAVALHPSIADLGPDCRLRVTLDDAGRLRRIDDRRTVRVGDGDRTLGLRITSTFDDYGSATAPRPRGSVDVDAGTRLRGLLQDFQRY